ncbi:MAG: GGDEF domain-containing protein [Oscillospiraceae bacterium]|nr:GGDEF domain-containing protein [Oscillospiraceae bacterium]
MKIKNHLLVSIVVVFSLLTGYMIAFAFRHREQGDLVFIIFNIYALIAVVVSFLAVLRRKRLETFKRDISRKRLFYLAKNISSPAMLWNDRLTELIMNDALTELSEMKMRSDFDAKLVVPIFFGKKTLTDADISALVSSKDQEFSFTAPSGMPHDIIWNTTAVETDDDGTTWLLSIGLDLNRIRKMQSELETYSKRLNVSEGRHNLTMELTDVGLLLIEQGNDKLFPSEKLQAMLGLKSDVLTVQELRKRIYPLDVVAFDSHVQTMRNHMRDFIGRTETLELRICAADGQYRWYSYRFKATDTAESGRLVVGGSVIDVTKEKEKDAQIEQIAYEDAVTGLPNRNKLMIMGNELYQCTLELSNAYWVIVIDIDRFHLINDTCGYAAGNELLKSFADAMIRQQNLGGFGARISGDNFALIMRDTGDDDAPAKVVGRIQRVLATKAVGALSNRSLTCSAGFAKMPSDGGSFEEILEHAEFALSSGSKVHGSINRYTHEMHDTIIQESNLETQLSEAVMNNELVLYYQPKVSLETGEIIGMEALIRWKHPSGKLISPGVFIPIAERSQLIIQITRFVMDEAVRQAKLWQTMGLPEIVMSINFSSTDFYQNNICNQIQKTLRRHGLDPRFLEIELTESMALMDIDTTASRMQELREAGIQLAMDDFGTGYSSLSYLHELPFTMVKLDRSFVVNMHDDPVVQEIVHSVARIAAAKQIKTIAEGVETPEQAKILREAGCDYVQGFLYGHPMSAQEAEQFIRNNPRDRKTF